MTSSVDTTIVSVSSGAVVDSGGTASNTTTVVTDATTFDSLLCDTSTSIYQKNAYTFKLRCFPNPNSGQFTLEIDLKKETGLRIKVYHINGRLMFSEVVGNINGNYTHQIDLNENAKGVYYLQVQTDDTLITQKIIVH